MARSPITISTDRTTRGNLLPHLARSPRSVDSFFYTIGTPANWVVTSPTGGFSRQISENPRRDRWPSLEHSRTSEVAEREREREEGEGGRRDTRRASHRRGRGRRKVEYTGRERDKWAEVWGKHIPYRYSLLFELSSRNIVPYIAITSDRTASLYLHDS